MQVPLFKFRFISMQQSSAVYGHCEHCHTWASEIWLLSQFRYFDFTDGSRRYQGWTYIHGIFGHAACLQIRQRPVLPRVA